MFLHTILKMVLSTGITKMVNWYACGSYDGLIDI